MVGETNDDRHYPAEPHMYGRGAPRKPRAAYLLEYAAPVWVRICFVSL